MKYLFLFGLIWAACADLLGQNDSLGGKDTILHTATTPLSFRNDTSYVDTSLRDALNLGYGLPFDRDLYYADFSNVGETGIRLIPVTYFSDHSNFNLYNRYTQKTEDFLFYDVPSPYTELAFRLNYTEGQYTRFKHTQNFMKGGNFLIDYQRSNSQGQFARQATLWNQFHGNARWEKDRIKGILWLDWNGVDADQNGGISNRTSFLQNAETDRTVFPINLQTAGSSFEYRNFGTDWSYQIDSTQEVSIRASRTVNRYVYTDDSPVNTYYQAIFNDSNATYDSLQSTIYEFNSNWKVLLRNNSEFSVGLNLLNYAYYDGMARRVESPLSAHGVFVKKFNKAEFRIRPELWFTSVYAGDIRAQSSLSFDKLLLNAEIFRQSPSLHWFSNQTNHVRWTATPQKVSGVSASANYNWSDHISIYADYHLIQNYIYLDSNIRFAQGENPLNYVRVGLKYGLEFWVFHLDGEIAGQYADQSYIRVPAFLSINSLYYEGKWFENALLIRVGGRLNYVSRYKGNEFAPMLAMDYLQRDDNIMVGNYPLADIFVSAKIRTFKAYILFQHATKGFFGFNYFATPYHPLPERALRIGLSWNFFN